MSAPPVLPVCGILLLDKPLGLSSNAALQRVRRCFGRVKAGHAGSLDPLASGMLPICLGEATKVVGSLLSERKTYRFELALGEQRSTGDAEGELLRRCPVPELSATQIESALMPLRGEQDQVPPMYSALKRDGQPLYKLARQGISVAREPRRVRIEHLVCLQHSGAVLGFEVRCSKGTYVRVLAEQIAEALGSCGYVSSLRRLSVEPFSEATMCSLAEVEAAPGSVPLLPADAALPHLPAVQVDAAGEAGLRQGREVRALADAGPQSLAAGSAVRLYGPGRRFVGLGEWRTGGLAAPRRLLGAS